MGEQSGKIGVYLFKRCQQPLAAFAVQGRNAGSQLFDSLFQIRFFLRQCVIFGVNRFGVFFGAQIHGPQCFALTAQALHIGIKAFGVRHFVGIHLQRGQQLLWRGTGFFCDAFGGQGHGFAGSLGPCFGTGAGFAGLACQTFPFAFRVTGGARCGFSDGQRIGSHLFAGISHRNGVDQVFALDRNVFGGGGRFGQFFRRFGLPCGQFRHAPFSGFQTVPPARGFFDRLLFTAHPCFAFAAQFILQRPARQHGYTRRLDLHFNRIDGGTGVGQIGQIINRSRGVVQPITRLGRLVFITRNGQLGGLKLAARDGFIGLGARSHSVGIRHMPIGGPARIAGLLIGAGKFGQP